MAGRVKTMNESIYYNVDRIHTAIAENSRITFQYFQWNVDKKMELRHDGALYEVSPWSLSWDDENYYLIAYDSNEGIIKHFRVDKMLYIKSMVREEKEGRHLNHLIWLHMPAKCLACMEAKKSGCALSATILLLV